MAQQGVESMSKNDGKTPLTEHRDTKLAAQAIRILWNPNASRAQKAIAASVLLPVADEPTRNKK